MKVPKQFINAMLLLTFLLVSCLLEDLEANVFHDSSADDNAARSTKTKNKNSSANQQEYLSKLALAGSSKCKSIGLVFD
jgi:hypothetical protein